MASRLGGSSFKRKQLAITLSSLSVLKIDSQNSHNKKEQEQDNEKSERRILKKVVDLSFFSFGKWKFEWLRYNNGSNAMYCDFCQHTGR